MKRILTVLLTLTLVLTLAFSLISCKRTERTIEGRYQDVKALTTYTFSGNDVTLRIEVIDGEPLLFEGTYKIKETKDGTKTIIFDFASEEAEGYDGEFAFEEGTENTTSFIRIGVITYTEVH